VGCGLRREELATLTIETIQQREGPLGPGRSPGQGQPLPQRAHAGLGESRRGPLGRGRGNDGRAATAGAISQKGVVGEGLTAQAVYLIVKGSAAGLGIEIAPHDLRRTSLHVPLPDASSAPLPSPSHGSRSGWFAIPFLYGSFIHYFPPVYPDANQSFATLHAAFAP
jgi:hypothetical protein